MCGKSAALGLALLLFLCGCDSSTTTEPAPSEELSLAEEVSPTEKINPTEQDKPAEERGQPKVDQPANQDTAKQNSAMPAMGAMPTPAPEDMVFKDEVETNVEPPKGLDGLVFIDTNNKRVQLRDYVGKKHVVLVFTEGFSGMLCPFCKTHTSRLVANYKKFAALNAEVLVVYPGGRDHIDEFITAARTVDKEQVAAVPFPIVLDPKLEAVDHFDIRSMLAHPSTYVIDKQGNVQLAYVGKDMSPDRPSIQALLETLERAESRK